MYLSRVSLALATLLCVVAVAGPALAQVPVAPAFSSGQIEFVTNVPIHADGAGAWIDHEAARMFITDSRTFSIYDISVPEDPQLTGTMVRPQQPYAPEEDLDSNGRIAIIGALRDTHIIDVTGDTPVLISTLTGTDEHTMTCVMDCTFVYGSSGAIIDIQDPTDPIRVERDWDAVSELVSGAHDVTEVAPGIVVTASNPMLLLDARDDPANPKLITSIDVPDDRFLHGVEWPNGGTDDLLLVGGEEGGVCDGVTGAAFTVYRVDDRTGPGVATSFTHASDTREPTGVYVDGQAPYDTFCAHWFDPHPSFRNGGLVAMAWYEHGTRFFDVKVDGSVEEIGYYIPALTSASAAYWINDEILYVVDYQRGLDVLRWTAEVPSPGAPTDAEPAPAPAPAADTELPTTGSGAGWAAGLVGLGLLGGSRRRGSRSRSRVLRS